MQVYKVKIILNLEKKKPEAAIFVGSMVYINMQKIRIFKNS